MNTQYGLAGGNDASEQAIVTEAIAACLGAKTLEGGVRVDSRGFVGGPGSDGAPWKERAGCVYKPSPIFSKNLPHRGSPRSERRRGLASIWQSPPSLCA